MQDPFLQCPNLAGINYNQDKKEGEWYQWAWLQTIGGGLRRPAGVRYREKLTTFPFIFILFLKLIGSTFSVCHTLYRNALIYALGSFMSIFNIFYSTDL